MCWLHGLHRMCAIHDTALHALAAWAAPHVCEPCSAAGALNTIGFSWITSPASTELETVRFASRLAP